MIKLFNYKENNFNSNGIATIQPLTLMEYKETSLNGWHIETEIPIKYNYLIKEGMIALVETKSKGAQPFLISNITKTTKTLHFVAKHYVFDSINYVLEDVRPTNMSAAGALKYINDRTDIKSPFTTNSNVSATNTAYFINKNMLEALDTIQERWGGVYDVDKFHINLKNKVGIDRGDTIMYGKNLEGLKVFEDWSNVVTKLLPVGFDGITLPETFLYSEIDYGKPYTKVVRFETELEDEERTEEALIQELRANALEYLKENEVPKLSYEVESNINQRLGIGDTIHVKHPVVDILTEVIAYEYNVLTKRVIKITFGNYKRSVKKKIDSIKNSIKEVAEKTNDFETIINDQTNIINDMNKKGHVYIDDNQIMVLDKIPKETAKHVWRWNMGGLGYSENGIEGPFKQAWTIDGKFNTEFIAANTIMTNQLHSSVGSSLDISSNESIKMVVNQLANLNSESNLIPNLTASVGAMLWKFKGGKRKLTKDNYLFKGGTLNSTFIPKIIIGSLSQWGKSFYTSGSAISPKAYVVPGYDCSYRSKRFTGSQSLEIVLHEFSYLEQETAFKKTSLFKGNDEIIEVTTQLDNRTNFIALEFITGSDVTIENRLEIADDMFNRGNPKSWEMSANEAKMYAEAQFEILDDSIKSTVDDIKIVEGKVEKNESQINQMSDEIELRVEKDGVIGAIIVSSEGLKIPSGKLEFDNAVGKNVNLSGKLTTNDLTATGGTVGAMELRNGYLTKTYTEKTKTFTQSDKDRLYDIVIDKIIPTQKDFEQYDLNQDGILNLVDMVILNKILEEGPNPDTRTYTLSIGGDKGVIKSSSELTNSPPFESEMRGSTIKTAALYANSIRKSESSNPYISLGDDALSIQSGKGKSNIFLGDTNDNMAFFNPLSILAFDTARISGSKTVEIQSNSNLMLSSNPNNYTIHSGYGLRPDDSGKQNLGAVDNRWKSVYLSNQPNVSSDYRIKKSIQDIPQDLIEHMVNLQPKQYVQNGQVHYGYIAQDVERELYKYCVNKYGYENATLAMDKYAFIHKSESYLSLLYGEIQVLKDAYYKDKIQKLENDIEELKNIVKELVE